MVDAVICNLRHEHQPDDTEEIALFFADDGMMTGTTQERVQASLDIITRGFASLGLRMNARKTKFMEMKGGEHCGILIVLLRSVSEVEGVEVLLSVR